MEINNLQKIIKMAALSHMKNRKSQKLREGFEYFIARCLDGGTEVHLNVVMEIFENTNIKLDAKDQKKFEKLANKDQMITRLESF